MPQYAFSEINDRLDDWRVFNNMVDSPYYRDAGYENSLRRNMNGVTRRSAPKCASVV